MLYELTTIPILSSFNRRSLVLHDLIDRAKALDPVTVWCAPGTKRYQNVRWIVRGVAKILCAPGSSTYITVALTAGSVSAMSCISILAESLRRITDQLAQYGDSLIPLGVFIQGDRFGNYELYLVNSNNHQQSWGVVSAALTALRSFLVSLNTINRDWKGGVQITVFDGANEVAQGTIA